MANCLECSKLERRSKAGYVRYQCGIGGGEIAPQDLKPGPGFMIARCAFGGPFETEEQKVMADQIDWTREYDGKPLCVHLVEWRDNESLSFADVTDRLAARFGVKVPEKRASSQYYYTKNNRVALLDAWQSAATKPEPAPATEPEPAPAAAAAAPDILDAEEQELVEAGSVTVLNRRRLEDESPAAEFPSTCRLLLELDGVTVDIRADSRDLLLERMADVGQLFVAMATSQPSR